MFLGQRFVKAVGMAAILLLLTAGVVSAQFSPQVFAINQDVVDGIVNVARVTSDGEGWLVVSNADGEALGSAAVPDGISATVSVEIDSSGVADGDTLTVSLYSDDGDGAFDPATDTPVEVNGAPVSIEITAGAVGSTLLTALGDGAFATFIAGIEGAGISEELADGGPYTIFAPTDAALAASTLPADAEAQAAFALGMVVPGIFTTDVLTESQELATLAGTTLDVQVADDGSVTVNGFSIAAPDGTAYNGVVHRIEGVILPVVAEPATEEPSAEVPAVEAAAVVTDTAAVTDTSVVTTTEAVATAVPAEEATPEATAVPVEEAAATEAPAEEATAVPAEEATAAPAEEAVATEEPAEEATAAPAEEAVATEAPAEEATAEEATPVPAEEAAATLAPAEEAPETLPATGAAPASPITLMLVAGLVLVGLAIFAVAFRRRPA